MSKRTLSEYIGEEDLGFVERNIHNDDETTVQGIQSQEHTTITSNSKKPKTLQDNIQSEQDELSTEAFSTTTTISSITNDETLNSSLGITPESNNLSNDHSSDTTNGSSYIALTNIYDNNNNTSSSSDYGDRSLNNHSNGHHTGNGSHKDRVMRMNTSALFHKSIFDHYDSLGTDVNDDFIETPRSTVLLWVGETSPTKVFKTFGDDNCSEYDAQFAQALQNSLNEDSITNDSTIDSVYSTKLFPEISYHQYQPATASAAHFETQPENNFKNNSNQKNKEISIGGFETQTCGSSIDSYEKIENGKSNPNSKSPSLGETTLVESCNNNNRKTIGSSSRVVSITKSKQKRSVEDEDVIDLNQLVDKEKKNTYHPHTETTTPSNLQKEENNLFKTMPIQSATTGSESSDPTQNSKRIQQVPGVNATPSSEAISHTNISGSVVLNNDDQSSLVNNKKTLLFSDNITYKHLICITPKNAGEVSNYQVVLRFDEKSSYTSKSEKQCQFIISAKSDLKRLIELISDHTNLSITTVCFKKTLGGRQKIIPLSTKLPAVFDKITLQKPVTLFINGKEFLELDYNNMYTDVGNELFREKKFDEALECYNTSLKHFPNESRVLSNRALCLIKLNRFYESFQDLSIVISSDKTEPILLEKAMHRRAHALYELSKNFQANEEMTNVINSMVANTRVKDESLEVKLNFLCMKDMHSYLEKVGIPSDYATVIKKKEIEWNDVKLVKSFHYLLQHVPKLLNYCLITKKEVSDLKLSTVFPASIYSPENKDSSLIYTPLPFCSREWYDSEMARYEELFSVKLWKPFYDNNEDIHGKTLSSQELYKFIIFTAFKYLLSNPDYSNMLTCDMNAKIFTKILLYLAFGAGTPPKAYLYINNKSNENKIAMREYVHQNIIEYVHIQVRDFHFIVEFKQPASSTFSPTDSSYGAKENRVKHISDTFSIRVGDELPNEILEHK